MLMHRTVEISVIHNEEEGFREFDTHGLYLKVIAKLQITYLKNRWQVTNVAWSYKEQEAVEVNDHPRQWKNSTKEEFFLFFSTLLLFDPYI